jgi:hypothetical protein
MDPEFDFASTSSSYQPTASQASFRFAPPTDTARIDNYRRPFVEDVPEPRLHRPPTPPASTDEAPDGPDQLRQCRICFDTVSPPYDPSPELGRLISPCICRGSSRYVHAACLQTWRETSSQAFYTCPTCKYAYRLRRLSYASLLSSTGTTFAATSGILLFVVWALGFVSGPILAAYLDVAVPSNIEFPVKPGGWAEHFLRGLASLGLLGFFKVIYLVGPSSWWSLRNSGMMGRRDRVSRLTWIVIALGVANFFVWLWRKVGDVVKRRMDKMAVEVMDIGEGGDGEVREEERVPWKVWFAQEAARLWQSAQDVGRGFMRGDTGDGGIGGIGGIGGDE